MNGYYANLLQVERRRKSQTRQSKRRLSCPSMSPGPCHHTLLSSPLSGRRLQCIANILFVGSMDEYKCKTQKIEKEAKRYAMKERTGF